MNLHSSAVHQIDTRKGTTLTVFDGSREDESKLAKQFWNSVALIPPVESTLVCEEIKQRTRSRTLNDGKTRPKFSATMTRTKEEKSLRDTLYDEKAALQQAEDETKRIRAVGKRHQQVRQLFRQQAKVNRTKKEQWIIPQFSNCPTNIHYQGSSLFFQEEPDDDDADERQIVSSLPD